jgi:hypothetical protein
VTVHVGTSGRSHARYRLSSAAEVRQFLHKLASLQYDPWMAGFSGPINESGASAPPAGNGAGAPCERKAALPNQYL